MKFSLLGWLVCQFKYHKLVPGYYHTVHNNGVDSHPVWIPLHCSRCGLTFGKKYL